MNRARLGRIQLSGDGGATLAVDLERLRSGNDVNDNYLQDVYYVGDGLFPAGWVRPDIGWVPPILDDSELVDHAAGAARLHLFTHGDGYTNWASELVPDILEAGETYALTVLHYEDADGYYVSLALTEADDDTLVYMSQPIESEKLEVTDLTLAIPASHTKGIVATSADVNLGGELLVEDFRFWTRPPVKTWTGAELVAAGSGWDNISYAHIDDGQRELTPDGDSLHAEFSGDDFTCQPVNPANGRCLYERTLALDLPDSCAEEIEIEVSYQPQADANGSSDNDLAMAFGDGTSLIASGIYDDRTRIELIDYTDGDDIVSDTVALVAASNLSHGQVKAVAGAALTGVLTLTADGTDNYDVRMDGDRDGTYTVTLTEEDVGSSSFASGTYSPTTAYILMGDRHEAYVIDEVRITGCDFDAR